MCQNHSDYPWRGVTLTTPTTTTTTITTRTTTTTARGQPTKIMARYLLDFPCAHRFKMTYCFFIQKETLTFQKLTWSS